MFRISIILSVTLLPPLCLAMSLFLVIVEIAVFKLAVGISSRPTVRKEDLLH